jgi:hypothetical protein
MAAAVAAAEKPSSSSKGQAWFCTTGLPSDIVIEVDDMTFHLHKVFINFLDFCFYIVKLFYSHFFLCALFSVSFDVKESKASPAYNGARDKR